MSNDTKTTVSFLTSTNQSVCTKCLRFQYFLRVDLEMTSKPNANMEVRHLPPALRAELCQILDGGGWKSLMEIIPKDLNDTNVQNRLRKYSTQNIR